MYTHLHTCAVQLLFGLALQDMVKVCEVLLFC